MPTTPAAAPAPPPWRLIWEEVLRDQLTLRASALAFQTLASWLPLMAIVLAVLSGPTFEAQRERLLDRLASALVPDAPTEAPAGEEVPAPPAVSIAEPPPTVSPRRDRTGPPADPRERLKTRLRATVERLAQNVGKISGFAFLVLLLIASFLYRTIEGALNAIWKVRAGRSIFMKFAIVTALIFWGPVFLVLSLALTEHLAGWPFLGGYVAPVILSGAAFTVLYMVVPNARVRLTAALSGAFLAALLWELGKAGFLIYVSYALTYSRVYYGSLGLIPVILAWVYLSWVFILGGAEFAYLLQHGGALAEQWRTRQEQDHDPAARAEVAVREAAQVPALALAVAVESARRFRGGESPGGVRRSELAAALGADPDALARALDRLVSGGILAQVAEGQSAESDDPRYLPARDPAQCRMDAVLRASYGPAPEFGPGLGWEQAAAVLTRADREGLPALAALTLADLAAAKPAAGQMKGVVLGEDK